MKNQRPGKRPVVRVFWTSSPPKDHRKRLAYALALSVSIHVFILSLQFGVPGLGLPGISLPWEERRLQVTELTVRLEAARPPAPAPAAAPLQLRLSQSLSALPAAAPKPVTASRAGRPFEGALVRATPPPPLSVPEVETRTPAPAAKARARERKVMPQPRPQVLAQTDPQEDTFNVPPPKRARPEPQRAPERAAKTQSEESLAAVQAEQAARKASEEAARRKAEQAARKAAEEAARLAAEEAARRRADDYARRLALALEKEFEEAKQEEARLIEDALKQAEARRQALALQARELAEENARKEAEKLALERALALEQEAKKQEEAKRLALEQETLKRAEAAAREQAVARQKELEARRLAEEAAARAKQTAERQRADAEAAAQRERLAAQKGPGAATAPGAPSGTELAAKALDQLRRPGAARDEVLRPPPPPRAENPRRRSIFGVERDVGLRMYVESWRSKIERHGALNYRHWVSRIARDNPIVTVSIRSDGSLEDVVIHRSSGVRELDEAVLRIARLHAPYSAFPPALATRYDVIEIRRVWFFDNTLKIMDEL